MNIAKRIVTSANWDAGREGNPIIGIVLHTMVGYMQPSEDRFNNPASQVSVHYGIGMNGSIRQWVEEANTAYQAGNRSINQTTIGIEHEDYGLYNDAERTDQLYESSSDLVADICKRYNFPADSKHIFLHKDVIDKRYYPGGTACPDALDTNRIIAMAASKFQGGNMDYDALARRLLTLGMFLVVEGKPDPDRQPTQKEVQDLIDRLKIDPIAAIDNLMQTEPWKRNWLHVKYYEQDVNKNISKTAVLDYINKHLT
jgi:hypothetical protein